MTASELEQARAETNDAAALFFRTLARAIRSLGADGDGLLRLPTEVLQGASFLVTTWALRERFGDLLLGELADRVQKLWHSLDRLSSLIRPAYQLTQTDEVRGVAAVTYALKSMGARLLAEVLRSDEVQSVSAALTARLLADGTAASRHSG